MDKSKLYSLCLHVLVVMSSLLAAMTLMICIREGFNAASKATLAESKWNGTTNYWDVASKIESSSFSMENPISWSSKFHDLKKNIQPPDPDRHKGLTARATSLDEVLPPQNQSLIVSAAEENTPDFTFRIVNDLSGDKYGERNDVFMSSHKFWEEDIVANLYHNIGQLLLKWIGEERNSLLISTTLFFVARNLILRRKQGTKNLACFICATLFVGGIFYGIVV